MNTSVRSATELPSARGIPSIVQKENAFNSNNGQAIQQDSLRTILLVSSDDSLRPMIRAYLEHMGFAVISCTKVENASAIVSRAPAIQLLVIDLDSSGSRGVDVALDLTGDRPDLAAVIMAGPQVAENELRMVKSHTCKMLRKPIRLPELLAVIQGVFARQRFSVQVPPHAQPAPIVRGPRFASVSSAPRNLSLTRRKAEGDIR
jgi:DNA-binding response OmpR family regulator